MLKNKLFMGFALASLVGFAACGGEEAEPVEEEGVTTTEVVTDTELEEAEVTVPTVDTAVVETTTDVDVETETDTVDVPGE